MQQYTHAHTHNKSWASTREEESGNAHLTEEGTQAGLNKNLFQILLLTKEKLS